MKISQPVLRFSVPKVAVINIAYYSKCPDTCYPLEFKEDATSPCSTLMASPSASRPFAPQVEPRCAPRRSGTDHLCTKSSRSCARLVGSQS
eukprot:4063914-Pleurochrysis_carterae.AAC.3